METQFKKGNSGKPKGAKNRVNTEIRQRFEQLLDTVTVEQMAEDLLSLKPAERLNVIMGLAEFITPKLARTSLEHETPETVEGFQIMVIRNNEDLANLPATRQQKRIH